MSEQTNQEIVEAKIHEIVRSHLDFDGVITPELKFEADLHADSLDRIELVMVFEETFGLEISDADIERLETVGKVVRYIDARQQLREMERRRRMAEMSDDRFSTNGSRARFDADIRALEDKVQEAMK